MIRLFDDNEEIFVSNGIGPLPSALECYVSEEMNGPFELEMVYPVTGHRFSDIHNRSIIVCKPNSFENEQAFRVYSISKPLNGLVTINAAHISYDLNGVTVSPFSASGLVDALSQIPEKSTVKSPFKFETDKDSAAPFAIATPFSVRSMLLGQEGSILDIYGGEYEWDNFTVRLKDHRGEDRGVLISYGKNLLDIEQEENCSNLYTGVHPYYYSENDGLVEAPDKIVKVEGEFGYSHITTLDLSSGWSDKPSPAQIQEEAEKYIKENDIGVPKISIDISFIQLFESGEYGLLRALDEVRLGDTVSVRFEKLGIDAKAKCVSYKYNVLTNRYDTITLGDSKPNLATAISNENQSVKSSISSTKNYLEQQISGGGGNVKNTFTALYVGDSDDISTAVKLWRWTKDGISYSTTGITGPFTDVILPPGAEEGS